MAGEAQRTRCPDCDSDVRGELGQECWSEPNEWHSKTADPVLSGEKEGNCDRSKHPLPHAKTPSCWSWIALPQPTPAEPRIETVPEERAALDSLVADLRKHYDTDWDTTVPGKEFDEEIRRIVRKWQAGRARAGSSLIAEPNWLEVPNEQAWWWHWNGDDYEVPHIASVMWSGTANRYFVADGQNAPWCDELGGRWLKIEYPNVPDRIKPSPKRASPPSSPGAAQTCPNCGGSLLGTSHGLYCPNEHCKWGWEVEMDGSPLKPPIPHRAE